MVSAKGLNILSRWFEVRASTLFYVLRKLYLKMRIRTLIIPFTISSPEKGKTSILDEYFAKILPTIKNSILIFYL